MRFWTSRGNAIGFEKTLSHQMGRLATPRTRPQIDTGLAVVSGNELRVRVGEMQQMNIALWGHVVELLGRKCRLGEIGLEHQSAACSRGQSAQEFAPLHD